MFTLCTDLRSVQVLLDLASRYTGRVIAEQSFASLVTLDVTRLSHANSWIAFSDLCLLRSALCAKLRYITLVLLISIVDSEVPATLGHRCSRPVSMVLHDEGAVYLQRILQPHQSTVMCSKLSATSGLPLLSHYFPSMSRPASLLPPPPFAITRHTLHICILCVVFSHDVNIYT